MARFKISIPDVLEEYLAARIGISRGLRTVVVDQDFESPAEAELLFAQQTGVPYALIRGLAIPADTGDQSRAESLRTDRGRDSTIRTLSSITAGGQIVGAPVVSGGDPLDSLEIFGPQQPGGVVQPGFTGAGIPRPNVPFLPFNTVGEGETPFDGSIDPAIRFGPTNPLPGQDIPFVPRQDPTLLFPDPEDPDDDNDGGTATLPSIGGGVLGDDAFASLQEILAMIGNASLASDLLSPQFMQLLSNPQFLVEQVVGYDDNGNPITQQVIHPLVEVMQQAWETKLVELGRQGDNEAQIAIEQIRQAPFGVIVDEDTAVRLTEEATRAGITSEFGALSLAGASVDEILEGISRGVDQLRGLPPEEREFRLQMTRLQNQPQLQQQFLDFIGDPSAVGTAVGLFGRENLPFLQQGQQDSPFGTRISPGQVDPRYTGDGPARPPFIFPDQTADAAEGSEFAAIRNAAGPQTHEIRSTPSFDPGMVFGQMFNDPRVTLDFLPQGNFRGAGANTNLNELRDRSQEELQFLTGQAAGRGETPSSFGRRVRSNTPQGA